MKCIVCPTDFSERAAVAERQDTEEFDRDGRRRPKKYYAAAGLAGRRV